MVSLVLLDGVMTEVDLEETLFERFGFEDPSLINVKEFDGVMDLSDSPSKYNISVNVIQKSISATMKWTLQVLIAVKF